MAAGLLDIMQGDKEHTGSNELFKQASLPVGIPACQGGLGRPSWVSALSGGSRLVASGRVLSPRSPGTLMSPRSPPAKRPTLEKKSDSVRNQFELKTVTVAGAQELKNVCPHCNGNQSAHHVVTRLEDHLVGNKKAVC